MSRSLAQYAATLLLGSALPLLLTLGPVLNPEVPHTKTHASQSTPSPASQVEPRVSSPAQLDEITTADLLAMSDAELDSLDPALINLVVAREIPELAHIDIEHYLNIVDQWAQQIEYANTVALAQGAKTEPVYQHDPDLWAYGGMAIYLAGSKVNLKYTKDTLNPGNPSQTFLPGLIDTRQGTCASMPVLHLAIGHRLGWPLKGVVSRDHFWVRWDDGNKQFNLEATSAKSDGVLGEFASSPDEEYIESLETPPIAISSGSDFQSMTARQTLSIYLQSRAGYWAAHNDWQRAERDLLLARTCFPENRDIYAFLMRVMSQRASQIFTPEERMQLAVMLHYGTGVHSLAGNIRPGGASAGRQYGAPDLFGQARRRQAEADRINRENTARLFDQTEPNDPSSTESTPYNGGDDQ